MKDVDFYRGMIAAVAAVGPYDQPGIVAAIIRTADPVEFFKVARRDRSMRWARLDVFSRTADYASLEDDFPELVDQRRRGREWMK